MGCLTKAKGNSGFRIPHFLRTPWAPHGARFRVNRKATSPTAGNSSGSSSGSPTISSSKSPSKAHPRFRSSYIDNCNGNGMTAVPDSCTPPVQKDTKSKRQPFTELSSQTAAIATTQGNPGGTTMNGSLLHQNRQDLQHLKPLYPSKFATNAAIVTKVAKDAADSNGLKVVAKAQSLPNKFTTAKNPGSFAAAACETKKPLSSKLQPPRSSSYIVSSDRTLAQTAAHSKYHPTLSSYDICNESEFCDRTSAAGSGNISKVRFAPQLVDVQVIELTPSEILAKRLAMRQVREHMVEHMIALTKEKVELKLSHLKLDPTGKPRCVSSVPINSAGKSPAETMANTSGQSGSLYPVVGNGTNSAALHSSLRQASCRWSDELDTEMDFSLPLIPTGLNGGEQLAVKDCTVAASTSSGSAIRGSTLPLLVTKVA